MNHQFDELTKDLTQPVMRSAAFKKFGVGLAGMALVCLLTLPSVATSATANTSSVYDPAGDAMFPFDLYGAPVPAYLDLTQASVSLVRGVFHFEIKMSAAIPADADPGFTPGVNHVTAGFAILTDRKTAGHRKFFGQADNYFFNFIVGATYFAQDGGLGLGLGWKGFLQGPNGFSEIPLWIRGDTFIFEASAASLGDPASFDWVVGSECTPVPDPDEKNRSLILVDYAPDHDLITWPPVQP
ncbi:MAG TPA: hypothetical protein VL361_25585 [Candidatus Limnocylindrales bacterium]|jgi:hypothetical protein|nr:hypothetical protein [Candidatus Limnocylindrales bacterium]